MIIDNGRQVRLQITNVFDGMAGFSRGRVAFVPNKVGKKPEEARSALLDGEAVWIVVRSEGGIYTASVQVPT